MAHMEQAETSAGPAPDVNQPTILTLVNASPEVISGLSVDELAMISTQIDALADYHKLAKTKLHSVVSERFSETIASIETGSASIVDGTSKVTFTKAKSVDWDQDALKAIENEKDANGVPFWTHMVNKLSVPEAIFQKLDPAAQERFQTARTVKAGAVSIKFAQGGE